MLREVQATLHRELRHDSGDTVLAAELAATYGNGDGPPPMSVRSAGVTTLSCTALCPLASRDDWGDDREDMGEWDGIS